MAHASQRDPGFVSHPSFQDKIHCVAFVVDASAIDVLHADVSKNLLYFRSLIVERGKRTCVKTSLIYLSRNKV